MVWRRLAVAGSGSESKLAFEVGPSPVLPVVAVFAMNSSDSFILHCLTYCSQASLGRSEFLSDAASSMVECQDLFMPSVDCVDLIGY